jgi:hypothetical protein
VFTAPEDEKCDLHVMRHSAMTCDVYQITDVGNKSDWELQIMSIVIRLFSIENPHHCEDQVATVLIVPNTKARIEKTIGMRHWMRLFVRL